MTNTAAEINSYNQGCVGIPTESRHAPAAPAAPGDKKKGPGSLSQLPW